MFRTDRAKFYRQLSGNQSADLPPSPKEETLKFWRSIWNPDVTPFKKPSWFSDIEDHLCSIP